VAKDDKAVRAAADRVRTAALTLTDTYSLALSVLFLDCLDNAADTSVIESMVVRLLAGQLSTGGWGYECPPITAAEARRLKAEAEAGEARVLRGGRDLTKLPAKGKRTTADLPKEIQRQLRLIAHLRSGGMRDASASFGGDNSNTQFAILALWVGKRYGVPT